MSTIRVNTIQGLNTTAELTLPDTLKTTDAISLKVGANEVMTVNSDGVTKFPLTTMFEVRANATQTINTSSTTKVTLWGTGTTDIGGVFASNAFTAPVTYTSEDAEIVATLAMAEPEMFPTTENASFGALLLTPILFSEPSTKNMC